ncbi:MAG: GC-type dockerin domain-anchored protein [Planctomycetota bacterium]
MNMLRAIAVVAAASGVAAAQSVTLDVVVDRTVNETNLDQFESQTAESAVDVLGVVSGGAGRFVASSRVRFAMGYSVEPGGPTVALTFRRRVGAELTLTVDDPTERGYEIELANTLAGEAVVLGPDNQASPSTLAITASAGFFGFFDDDATDGVEDFSLLASTGVGSGTVGVDTADFTNISRVDAFNDQNLGSFAGTRSFAVRVDTGFSPAGLLIQNNLTGDGALVFGLQASLPQDPDNPPPSTFPNLDAIDAATIEPGDGLLIEAIVTFFCNAADIAPPATVLDLSDVDAFIAAFTAGEPAADLVEPFGVVDLSDVDAFIDAFLNGCS